MNWAGGKHQFWSWSRCPDRNPTGFCNSEPDPDRARFRKKFYEIWYGHPNWIDQCS